MRARVGQGEHRVAADESGVADDVDVERTRPEPLGSLGSLGPDPAEFRLDALGRRQQVERGQAGRHDEHRVQVVGLRRAADRRGLVDGRDGQHVSVRQAADGLHASLKGTQPVAQVAAHGQHHAVAHGQDRPVTPRTTGSGGPAAPAAAALTPGGGDPDGVRVQRHLVHAHAPGAGRGGERRDRHRGPVAVAERPRRAVRAGQQVAEETFPRRSDQDREGAPGERAHLGEVGEQRPVVLGPLAEPETGIDHDAVRGPPPRARPRPPAGPVRRGPRPPRRRRPHASTCHDCGRASASPRRKPPPPRPGGACPDRRGRRSRR